jgi:tetratricopeptide (TPR) repeat protein
VAWKVVGKGAAPVGGPLVVYWFPMTASEARASDLLISRYLALASAQCVGMAIVTSDNEELRGKYSAGPDGPVAVLAGSDGAQISRIAAAPGLLKATDVEVMLREEMDKRETALGDLLAAAKEKVSGKDEEGAVGLYTQVWEQRCLFPAFGGKAAKALKKLGKPVADEKASLLPPGPAPNFSVELTGRITKAMDEGLAAERAGKVLGAQKLYESAMAMDPADPVPVRFLGELHRHETGDWARARALFDQVLGMRADPISRAVAQHGLGKMTIHEGEFAKGLALFEESLRSFPLALTYRNLAVYWNSEKKGDKAAAYVRKAMELDPDDPYNQIFAATYMVALGRPKEAEEIARKNEATLAASYNLAVIYAQLGNREKALELLRRHFYEYEKFDRVRAKEMQEARDDIAFAALHRDPEFLKLTGLADSDGASYHGKMS